MALLVSAIVGISPAFSTPSSSGSRHGSAPPLRFPVAHTERAKATPADTTMPSTQSKTSFSLVQQLQHAEVKDGYRFVRDVEFAPDRKLNGDLYLPVQAAAGSKLPAVLIVHGGAWTLGNKSFPGETDLGERLAKHGFVAFSCDYRLIKDGGIYPKSIQDVRDAFGFLVQNADQIGIDKRRIGVFGASVGGMMALLAAYAPNSGSLQAQIFKSVDVKPRAAVCYAPLTDLRETELTWVIKYMDDTPWHSPEMFAEASPITYVKSACPTMCIHGTDDVTVAFQQSESLIKALQSAGVDAQLVSIPKVRHLPFHEEAGPIRELAFARLLEFFDKQLKAPQK